MFERKLNPASVILDPACGAGDLLIACSRHLLTSTGGLIDTINTWGHQLRGTDLHEPFVGAARARLAIAAASRVGVNSACALPKDVFPNIRRGDGISAQTDLSNVTHIVLNPPFTDIEAPGDCSWGRGKVSSAAMFTESIFRKARAGTSMVAVLPDVLRSGSRYAAWRAQLESLAGRVDTIEYGLFDSLTDVHVFLLHAIRGQGESSSAVWVRASSEGETLTVSDLYRVRTGSVVEYRAPHRGKWQPYLTPKSAPRWGEITQPASKRRFMGTLIQPPFVAVRRTSRPGDVHRAVATIVKGEQPVAVENHMLVVVPHDRSLSACRRLVTTLKDPRTTRWLDSVIRCRHLTVGSLGSVPIWGGRR